MKYFNYFPNVAYTYGNESSLTLANNITVYADIVDTIKDNTSFYNDYYLHEFERPDQLSQRLYNTPNYHWTFFLMNEKLRESGWPLSNRDLLTKAMKDYPGKTITTKTTLTDRFKIGQTITGNQSSATATIDHRHLDLGQLVLSNVVDDFVAGETVTSVNSEGTVESILVTSFSNEFESAHHYTNSSGEYVDIDPAVGPGVLLTEVTYLDRLLEANENLKQIRVIKPSVIDDIVNAFREAVRSG